jgi:hypothetical protein
MQMQFILDLLVQKVEKEEYVGLVKTKEHV